MTREELEALVRANAPVVDEIVTMFARRHGFAGDAATAFNVWASDRLIEDDYALLAPFGGESTFATYLAVVISGLARDYQAGEWGRWRPRAEGRRRGDLVVQLEMLVDRDGMTIEQAGAVLRKLGRTTLTNPELSTLLETHPRRQVPNSTNH